MNIMNRKWNSGFTIIELMIVLVIVAILLALAYPSYIQYVRKANRGEAQQLLLNWSINQEIWRANHTTYSDGVTADANGAVVPVPTHDKYTFSVSSDDAYVTSYTLQAQASGDQANDKARNGESCINLFFNQTGRKYNDASNTTKVACWD